MSLIWLPLAILSYIMQAVNGAVDRIIVHKNVTTSAVVSFWVAVFSVFTILILVIGWLPVPFAEQFRFEVPTWRIFGLVTLAGFLSQIGIYYMYTALEDGEATRVLSVLGALTPIATLLFAIWLLNENFENLELVSLVVLIVGAVVLTYTPKSAARHTSSSRWVRYIVLSSLILALQSVVIKIVFNEYHFISGFALTSIGALAYALVLLAVAPSVRKSLRSNGDAGKDQEKKTHIGWIIGNSALGGVAIIILNLAIDLGSPTFINALRGVQYAGVFAIALLLSKKHADLLDEELNKSTIMQKIAGIILVINGVTLLAIAS